METQSLPIETRGEHFLHGLPSDRSFSLAEAAGALRWLERQVLALSRDPEATGRGLVGMENLVRRLIQAAVLGEHCLIEGSPGLAKTRAAKALAAMLGLAFERIQFVPDLMPSDLMQRERLKLDVNGRGVIEWHPGPIFTNVLLADEINRASPKAQAALLEVTEERQVSLLYRPRLIARPIKPIDEAALLSRSEPSFGEPRIDADSHEGQVFVVLATMNPIEQEGVYPLSEAQYDRFAFLVVLDYPGYDALDAIGAHAFEGGAPVPRYRTSDNIKTLYFFARLRRLMFGPQALERWLGADNSHIRRQVADLIEFSHARPRRDDPESWRDGPSGPIDGASPKAGRVDDLLGDWLRGRDVRRPAVPHDPADALQDYAARLVTRLKSRTYPDAISGASPRGLLKLIRAGHAEALRNGHFDFDRPELLAPTWVDFATCAADVLRHRIRLSQTSAAMGMRSDTVIEELVEWVATRPRTTD